MKSLDVLDLQKNELQNARVQNLGAAPSSPVTGQLYYDTSTSPGILFWWDGTTWQAAKSGTPGANSVSNSILAQAPANTVKANITGALANETDVTLAAFKTWLALAEGDVVNLTSDLAAKAPLASPTFTGTVTVPTTTNATDAAQKQYVDAAINGLDWKANVRVATTANIATLAGGAPNTLDGVSLALNDRVLVKDQTTGSQNGIYSVTTVGTGANGTFTRATDADASAEVTNGMTTVVDEGTLYADTMWTLITNGAITLGTTSLAFTEMPSANSLSVVAPLVRTGNQLSLDTSSTTHVARVWTGALTGGATSEVVTHGLGTRDVQLQVINNASPWDAVIVTWEATSTTTATIRAASNLPAGYRVVVMA